MTKVTQMTIILVDILTLIRMFFIIKFHDSSFVLRHTHIDISVLTLPAKTYTHSTLYAYDPFVLTL